MRSREDIKEQYEMLTRGLISASELERLGAKVLETHLLLEILLDIRELLRDSNAKGGTPPQTTKVE